MSVYADFLEAQQNLKAPFNGRIALMTPEYCLALSEFMDAEGERVDGAIVVVVPVEHMPKDTPLLITHPSLLAK